MEKLFLFFLILHLFSKLNHSTSLILPLLPPTHQSCLLHFILQKGQDEHLESFNSNSALFYTEQEQLNFILKSEVNDYSDVFLISYSSYSSKNASSLDDEDGELGTRYFIFPKYLQFRWRESQCFRFLFLNSKSVISVINEPQISFWRYSELPDILILVPESYNDHNGGWDLESIPEMKDAGDFNGFKASIYFLLFRADVNHLKIDKLGFLCFMCPQQSSIKIESSFDGESVKKPTTRSKLRIYLGHRRKLYLQGLPDLTNLEEERNCELALYFHKTKECDNEIVFLQMVKTALNLTVERVMDLEEVESSLSTSVLLLNDNPKEVSSLGFGQSAYFLRAQTTGKLFYCTATGSLTFEAISWDIFLRSVHIEIWGCIIAIGVIYSVITKNPYLGLRVVMFLTGQAVPNSLCRRKLQMAPILPLILVSTCYLTLMTLDVVVPPAVAVITENKQLLSLGFKMIIPSMDVLPVIRKIANKSLEKFGIAWNEDYFVANPEVIKTGEALQPEFLFALGSINGIYHTHSDLVLYMRKLKLVNPRSNTYGNVTCSVVEQGWDEISFIWLVGGYLASPVVEYATSLLELGFNAFWTSKRHMNSVSNMQLSKYCQAHADTCAEVDDAKKLSMNSSIRIIFWFLLIFSSFALVSFGFEIMKAKLEKQCLDKNGCVTIAPNT